MDYLDDFIRHNTTSRLRDILASKPVLAGGRDILGRPEPGRSVAAPIPVMLVDVVDREAHRPFQEIHEAWNRRGDSFWRDS